MKLLFQEGQIGKLELKNRIVMPPMCMYASDNSGEIKTFHKGHYLARAIGGVGFIIVEATAIEPRGRISANDLGLWNETQIKAHKILNAQMHSMGAKTAIQIAHAGRKCTVEDETPIAPSAIAFSEDSPFMMPKAATLQDIEHIKELFIKSALRAKEANYDAIELHGAHGYFLCEFLSPLSNHRDDIYGGSLENRCRLLLEIAQELKQKIDLPLIVRISADEWMNEGWNIFDSIYLSKKLEKVGVDSIHVSSGGNQEKPNKPIELKPMYQADFAKEIKKEVSIPVIAVGLITTSLEGEKLLEEDYCDFVAYGRELLRSPNFAYIAANEGNQKALIHPSYQRAF
ncbi:MAG: NADH:flavin oxidoreductase/NADH oxidase [Arcobacteraceae bacterium]